MANQTVQLSSILSNYDHVLEATATAYNSAGSAAKENTAAVDSLAGRTKQVQAAFQDLATDTIDSQLVKSVLNLTTKLLELADTGLGQILTKIGLLTGVGWGISSLVGASKIIPVVTAQFANFSTALGLIGTEGLAAAGAIGSFGSIALPVVGIISAFAIAGYELYKVWKQNNPTIEEASKKYEELGAKLESNKERLAELSKIPWYEHTPEIEKELEALEKENAELKENIEWLDKRRKANITTPNGEPKLTVTKPSEYKWFGSSFSVESEAKAISEINKIYGEGTTAAKFYISTIKEIPKTATYAGDSLSYYLKNRLAELTEELKKNGQLSEQSTTDYANMSMVLDTVAAKDTEVANALMKFNEAKNVSIEKTNKLNSTIQFYQECLLGTEKGLTSLAKKYPELNNAVERNNNAIGVNLTKLSQLTFSSSEAKKEIYNLIAQETVFNNSKLDVSQQLTALQKLAVAAGVAGELIAATGQSSDKYNQSLRRLTNKGMSMEEAKSTYTAKTWEKWMDSIFKQEASAEDISNGGGGLIGGSNVTKVKETTDEALETFQNAYKDLQHQRDLDIIDEAQYYDSLEILMNQYKNSANANLQNMYQYEKEIYEGRKKLSDELVNKQISAYKALFSMGSNVAQDRINELQEELKLLEEQNDELEDSIRLEQLQDKLAQARSQKVMVYKDGRFQYVSDTDEVASAQADIVAYEHEKILDAEKKRINDQIAYWQEWGSKWSSAVSDYEEQQNDLLVLEQFGITREDNLWDTRIKNLQDFVNEYSNLLNKLSTAQAEVNKQTETNLGGVAGTAALGDGKKDLQISYTGKPQGSYASAEDDPGVLKDANGNVVTIGSGLSNGYFIGTTNSGETVSIKAQATTNAGMPLSQKVPTTSRDTSLAGETVSAGGYTIKYDNDGYVTSMKRNKFAQGTTSASRGLSLVGENGPELRVLGQGDGIIPSEVTRNLWSWGSITPSNLLASLAGVFNGSNGGQMISIANLNLPGVHDGQSFVEYMRNNFWRTTVQAVTV